MHSARHASFSLAFCLAATTLLAAQTKPATTAAHPAHRVAATIPPLPKNIPPVKAPVKVQYAMRYQEIKTGTGDEAAPGMFYSVNYTGWLASDGTKFDSSYDRGQPIEFPQGVKRVIIGWDQGFEGMRVGGKRRLFIPWQLAYGAKGRPPIPPKADLIFDIELMGVRDPNAPPPAPATPPAPQTPPAPERPQ
jgi:peptidylprolyl isomerase